MKAYTDTEQSKKLAKILPLESADMYYCYGMDIHTKKWDYDIVPTIIDASNQIDIGDIPCWSLAALMDVYPMVVGRDMDMYCCWQNHKNLHSRHYDNPVDACVAMIEKLHEQKLL